MLTREIDPAALRDIEKFEKMMVSYLAGDLDEDRFRIFRLNNGIYGQRQGGHNQMVRVKIPYGSLSPDQLEMLAHIADEYSRGWAHITTRQNVQLHFVELERARRNYLAQLRVMVERQLADLIAAEQAPGPSVPRHTPACPVRRP